MARKTIRLATKVKNPKTFEQKYKTIDGKILTYTPHTAWVQTFGKQPRLLRNSGTAFVPNPVKYGPCRPSRLSDCFAYKSARRTGPCKKRSASSTTSHVQGGHHNGATNQANNSREVSTEPERKQSQSHKKKPTGKRTGGKPVRKLQTQRGMSLETKIEQIPNMSLEKEDDLSSTSEETTSASPKRQNQKSTPPATATRKSTRNRQATLATALGNPIPISTIQITSATGIK